MWLVRTNERWLPAFWRHISQPFAEAALTKLRSTSAKLNGVICTEGRKAKLHCPIMFIAERQNVRAHWSSLASTWRHLLFRWLRGEALISGAQPSCALSTNSSLLSRCCHSPTPTVPQPSIVFLNDVFTEACQSQIGDGSMWTGILCCTRRTMVNLDRHRGFEGGYRAR